MRKGFTLVEIMIVVAIIALLAAIAIPNLLRARVNANDGGAQALLRSVSTAMESYAAANAGCYPTAAGNLTGATPPYIAAVTLGTPQYGHTVAIAYATNCGAANTYTISATEIAGQSDQTWSISTGGVLTGPT